MEYDVVEDSGVVMYYKKGTKILHREDGPAAIYNNGCEVWYIEGEELTEEEFNDRMKYDIEKTEGGSTYYYKKGTHLLHREDGPAVIYPNGDKSWYINGKLHREDGPAIDLEGGYKAWFIDGLRHREDGPAEIHYDGSKSWYINGEKLTEEEFNERQKYDIIRWYGCTYYHKKGTKMFHREEGPAVICEHLKSWWKEGERHREDGPALIYADGEKSWYLEGKELTEEEFNERMKYDIVEDAGTTCYYKKGTFTLHREDGPAYSTVDGYEVWYIEGKFHREDGPAVIFASGNEYWYKENKLHREDGPAIEYTNGDRSWYLHGEALSEEEFNKRMKYDIRTNTEGDTYYYKKWTRTLHREDGPAVIYNKGFNKGLEIWYLEGEIHREDGPAVVYPDGNQYWYIEGKELTEEEFNERMKYDIDKTEGGATYYFKRGTFTLHREDGPAVIYPNGDKSWYIDGVLHREDGPAIDLKGGYKAWYKDAKLHREDGPAVIKENGSKLWYIEGVNVTEEELNERMKYDIDKTEDGTNYYFKKGTKILHREDGPAIDLNDRYKAWYKDGELHREDGPAILYKFGHEEWYLNGNLHREDGPAIISGDGSQYWYINGQYHREDGPALILYNGYKSWYINGKELTEEEFNEFSKYDIVEECGGTYYYKKGTRTLHREDGPAVEFANGDKTWYIDGVKHREDGPAVIEDNYKAWYKNGKSHREDGPAVIDYTLGLDQEHKAWYINGKELTEEEFNERMKYDITAANGVTIYYKKGTSIKHREEGPAIINIDGSEAWYVNGKLHREDGPAVVQVGGYKHWYINDEKLTEEEFNARMKYDIVKEYDGTYYYKEGTYILHREDGPAVIEDNYKAWYKNGKSHREDGPAFEYANGEKSWYLFGDQLTEEEFNARMGNRTEYKITTGAFILEIDGEELAFKTKEELVDYLTHNL